jgi:hypothetical protein
MHIFRDYDEIEARCRALPMNERVQTRRSFDETLGVKTKP